MQNRTPLILALISMLPFILWNLSCQTETNKAVVEKVKDYIAITVKFTNAGNDTAAAYLPKSLALKVFDDKGLLETFSGKKINEIDSLFTNEGLFIARIPQSSIPANSLYKFTIQAESEDFIKGGKTFRIWNSSSAKSHFFIAPLISKKRLPGGVFSKTIDNAFNLSSEGKFDPPNSFDIIGSSGKPGDRLGTKIVIEPGTVFRDNKNNFLAEGPVKVEFNNFDYRKIGPVNAFPDFLIDYSVGEDNSAITDNKYNRPVIGFDLKFTDRTGRVAHFFSPPLRVLHGIEDDPDQKPYIRDASLNLKIFSYQSDIDKWKIVDADLKKGSTSLDPGFEWVSYNLEYTREELSSTIIVDEQQLFLIDMTLDNTDAPFRTRYVSMKRADNNVDVILYKFENDNLHNVNPIIDFPSNANYALSLAVPMDNDNDEVDPYNLRIHNNRFENSPHGAPFGFNSEVDNVTFKLEQLEPEQCELIELKLKCEFPLDPPQCWVINDVPLNYSKSPNSNNNYYLGQLDEGAIEFDLANIVNSQHAIFYLQIDQGNDMKIKLTVSDANLDNPDISPFSDANGHEGLIQQISIVRIEPSTDTNCRFKTRIIGTLTDCSLFTQNPMLDILKVAENCD